MTYLRVKNWSEFQHYKDRAPPWIKLHRSLLEDYEFSMLPDAAKAHLVLIWLFAAGNDGRVPSDARFLARKLATTDDIDINLLIQNGFLVREETPEQDASEVVAERKRPASTPLASRTPPPSREAEAEAEAETPSPAPARPTGFDRFWAAYPKRASKGDAEKAWKALKPNDAQVDRIVKAAQLAARRERWKAENGRYIPHPATWLRAKGWEDDDLQPTRSIAGMPWWAQAGYGTRQDAEANGVKAPA